MQSSSHGGRVHQTCLGPSRVDRVELLCFLPGPASKRYAIISYSTHDRRPVISAHKVLLVSVVVLLTTGKL